MLYKQVLYIEIKQKHSEEEGIYTRVPDTGFLKENSVFWIASEFQILQFGGERPEVILNSGIRVLPMKKCPRTAIICIQQVGPPPRRSSS